MTQLTAEQLAAGWLPHDGGPCPVSLDSRPKVVFDQGPPHFGYLPAGCWNWVHIIGYLPDPEFAPSELDLANETLAMARGIREGLEQLGDAPLTEEEQAIAALLAPDEALVEAVARAVARADGLDYDEPCGIQDDEGDCDSGTCVGAYLEDHDADYAREWYDRHARAALIAAGTELAKRKGEV